MLTASSPIHSDLTSSTDPLAIFFVTSINEKKEKCPERLFSYDAFVRLYFLQIKKLKEFDQHYDLRDPDILGILSAPEVNNILEQRPLHNYFGALVKALADFSEILLKSENTLLPGSLLSIMKCGIILAKEFASIDFNSMSSAEAEKYEKKMSALTRNIRATTNFVSDFDNRENKHELIDATNSMIKTFDPKYGSHYELAYAVGILVFCASCIAIAAFAPDTAVFFALTCTSYIGIILSIIGLCKSTSQINNQQALAQVIHGSSIRFSENPTLAFFSNPAKIKRPVVSLVAQEPSQSTPALRA